MSSLSGSQSSSGKKRKAVNVHLLNKEDFVCYVDVKSKFQDVFNQVVTYLTLRETEYFGLAFKKDGEFQFISNEEKIYKHVHKSWKSGPGDGFDGHGRPIVTLYFRVQFYVDQVVLLREKVTRHLYYLQLKDNVLNYHHGGQEEKSFQAAGYALQADFGNFTTATDIDEYFDPREYFPAWIVEKHGLEYLVNNTPVLHRDLHSLARSEAELRFIKEMSVPPSAHNLHFYRLRKKKTDKAWNAWLGICAKGIEIYEDVEDGFKDLISTFLWPDIGKLTFDKKKFEIRSVGTPAGRKFSYYTESDVKSKYLLTLSRNTHMFQMAIQPKLMEIRHLEEEDKRRYRESYVHGELRECSSTPGSYRPSNKSPRPKTTMGNRYSVISDASSNTTSGIASDKMTVSFEENDDASREIIIDGPPMPPSMLLNTPSQTRSTLASTLPGYKPSPVPGANRSPVLDHGAQYHTYTFPTSRVPVTTPTYRLTNQSNVSTGSVQSDRSGSGQSEGFSVDSSSSGSYRKRMKAPGAQSGMYSPVPMYPDVKVDPGAREKTSRPASRSASRKDSFKNILEELKAHQNWSISPPPQPGLLDTPQLQHVPSFHMEDMDYSSRPLSLSGSSDHRGNKSFSSDLSTHSSQAASMSTVTSHDYENVVILPQDSVPRIASGGRLQEAEEVVLPPTSFQDEGELQEIPAESLHVYSQTETDLAVTQIPENEEAHESTDLQVDEDDEEGAAASDKKKGKPTQISVMNKKEILHPEIEEIRTKPYGISLPFITALCNDQTLQQLHSRSGSLVGSYDMASIRSTDSRISRISVDTDIRRLSISGYPGTVNGGQPNSSFNSHRPFSWHSESFDLDAHLGNLTAGNQPLSENHRSVPQSLFDFSTDTPWPNAIPYAIPGGQAVEQNSQEAISTHNYIPQKLSSGGHSTQEANIRNKSILKENVGIA